MECQECGLELSATGQNLKWRLEVSESMSVVKLRCQCGVIAASFDRRYNRPRAEAEAEAESGGREPEESAEPVAEPAESGGREPEESAEPGAGGAAEPPESED